MLLANAGKHLIGGLARAWQIIRVNTPDVRNMLPCRRIVDFAIAGQLIRLLPMFASPLAIALPCQAAIATTRAPRQPQSQGQINISQDIIHALTLLFRTAPAQYHRRTRHTKNMSSLDKLLFRDASDTLYSLRPVGGRDGFCLLEAAGALADIVKIDELVSDENMEQAVRQGDVCSRHKTQVQRGVLCSRRGTRINRHQASAASTLLLEILHDRRHRLRDVTADQQNSFSKGNVFQRKR